MPLNRREFISIGTGAFVAGALTSSTEARKLSDSRIKAVLFDAFPIFDPRPIFMLAEELFPAKGMELSNLWRTRQFEYTWLRSLSNNYEDFWKVTENALVFAAHTMKLDLTPDKRDQLMTAYLKLKSYPDVLPALTNLKESGIRLGFLSNFTRTMMDSGIKSSGLENLFEKVLSTDEVKIFKPSPQAYQMGIDAFHLKREEFVFAAFAGWDAAGAHWFGYKTFWVNRLNAPVEELDSAPDGTGSNLNDLVKFVKTFE